MQKNSEEWRPVPDYEGLYEVSNHGRVLSLPRETTRGGVMGLISNSSYFLVVLCKDGKKSRFYIHRLVLFAFAGPCPPGFECRHLDGDPSNNSFSNLRWGTKKENSADRIIHGTHLSGERITNSKLTSSQVRTIKFKLKNGYRIGRLLAREYGVSFAAISFIKNGQTWRTLK